MQDILFLQGPSNTYTRHSTNAVSMLSQRRRRWPIIEKLTTPTFFIVFVWYIAGGSGYSSLLLRATLAQLGGPATEL